MRRVLPAFLLACVFTLPLAVAQAPAPGAPAGLAATAGDGSISLTWEDPGDAAITGYEYRVHADREQDWRAWKEITDSTPETVSHTLDLTNGVSYRVQVRARNSAGAGEASETAATPQAPAAEEAMAAAPPGAPAGLTAAAGDGSISLTWEDPGDATITGYEYRVFADREQDWREWKAITGTTHETVAHTLDLTNGVSYQVQVRARNSAGAGEASETAATPQAPVAEGTEEEAMAADAPSAADAAEGTTADAPSRSGEAAEGSVPAGEAPAEEAPAEELPRSGAPWIVIIVLAACLVIGIVIVVMRLRGAAGSADSQADADSQAGKSTDADSQDADS